MTERIKAWKTRRAKQKWEVLQAKLEVDGKIELIMVDRWPQGEKNKEEKEALIALEEKARKNLGQKVSNFSIRETTARELMESGNLARIGIIAHPPRKG